MLKNKPIVKSQGQIRLKSYKTGDLVLYQNRLAFILFQIKQNNQITIDSAFDQYKISLIDSGKNVRAYRFEIEHTTLKEYILMIISKYKDRLEKIMMLAYIENHRNNKKK